MRSYTQTVIDFYLRLSGRRDAFLCLYSREVESSG